MRHSRGLAIGGSIAIIVAALMVSYSAEAGFNPYPQTTTFTSATTCVSGAGCPGFAIDSTNLWAVNQYQDITSQGLTIQFTPLGGVALGSVAVFLDNVSLGVTEGPFAPGAAATVSVGVPTTITITAGTLHHVVVEGFYLGSTGSVTGSQRESVAVVAT